VVLFQILRFKPVSLVARGRMRLCTGVGWRGHEVLIGFLELFLRRGGKEREEGGVILD
jgi:hypothetical protein